MKASEIAFCEHYESVLRQAFILKLAEDNLTQKGRNQLADMVNWLARYSDRYELSVS